MGFITRHGVDASIQITIENEKTRNSELGTRNSKLNIV